MYIQPARFAMHTGYQANRQSLEKSMARLSTGSRFANTGDANAGEISVAQRFRHNVKRAQASEQAMQTGLHFLQTADDHAEQISRILNRMTEVAAAASDGGLLTADRTVMDEEFQMLKNEIVTMTRQATFNGNQQISRDVMVSYDANEGKVQFFTTTGAADGEISRKFDANGEDANGVKIGFSSSEDFTMSRDGRSFYFLGTVDGDGAGVVRVKKYDLDTNSVQVGSDLFATGDKMFVNEDGDLYVNGTSTLYSVDGSSLDRTATAVTDMEEDTEFSIYKDEVYYYRNSDNRVVKYNLNTTTTTQLTGVIAFGAGAHSFASSGKFIAEESPAGSIRVIDTSTGNEATLGIGAANTVTDLHFSEDGDRVYFVNQVSGAIQYLTVNTDGNDNVVLANGGTLAQGANASSFNGLDLGGASFGSRYKFALAQDGVSVLDYEAVDLNTYILGLANTSVDTFANASTAISDLKEAVNRLSFRRAKLGAKAAQLDHALNTNRSYIANASNAESQIRDVDVALETTELSIRQVRNQAAIAMLTQYNQISRNVLSLLTS